MKNIYTLILSFLIIGTVSAQLNVTNFKQYSIENKLKNLADKEFEGLNYAYAIALYKGLINRNVEDTSILNKLAYSYLINKQYDSALKYYQFAAKKGSNTDRYIPELYGILEKYDIAVKEYKALNNQSKLFNDRIIGFSNPNLLKKDSLDYKVYNTKINTPYNDFAAIYYKDGLVFESNRIQKVTSRNEFGWDGATFSNLYYLSSINDIRTDTNQKVIWWEKKLNNTIDDLTSATSNDTRTTTPLFDFKKLAFKTIPVELFNNKFDSKLNAGAISFTSDGQTAYFTKNQNKSKDIFQLEIWEVKKIDSVNWGKPEKLFFNNPNYSYFHPAVTPNGKRLYYISDQPNGFGGTDLYFIDKNEDGSWKSTNNAGQFVNTAGNELYPTISDNNLYISSDGHVGLGGLDIYQVNFNDKNITDLKHLSYPINSNKDDFSFILKKQNGFFTSNRYGSDDILSFDVETANILLKGTVTVDLKIKKNVLVKVFDKITGKLISSTIADDYGNYVFNLRPNRDFLITYDDQQGHTTNLNLNTNNYFLKDQVGFVKNIENVNINLPSTVFKQDLFAVTFDSIIDSLKSLTNNFAMVHHPFDRTNIIKEDQVIYNNIIKAVKSSKNNIHIVIISAADCNGSDEYNNNLSLRRASKIEKTLKFLTKNKIVKMNVGERLLVKPCSETMNKKEQVVNRYSYVFIIDKK